VRGQGFKGAAQVLGRGDRQDEVAGGQVRQVGGGVDALVESHAGQEQGVLAPGPDTVDHLRLTGLQDDRHAGPGADLGQGGAPGAGADDARMVEGHALAPLRP